MSYVQLRESLVLIVQMLTGLHSAIVQHRYATCIYWRTSQWRMRFSSSDGTSLFRTHAANQWLGYCNRWPHFVRVNTFRVQRRVQRRRSELCPTQTYCSVDILKKFSRFTTARCLENILLHKNKLSTKAKSNKTTMPPIEVIANCELCVTKKQYISHVDQLFLVNRLIGSKDIAKTSI